ncbi:MULTISPECIES: metallopeptidase family protein [Mumia]|uniref:metallopeptidase family protein n=1 Tax=Mumia TaxID=1546255 RepID=UPI00142096D8|nr:MULTISPECIES: metallopeptidase family protein [unclassified Mumia]QMW65580.1 metallopeptidase family protein [Mumia sp. ZJ1417]
MARRSSPRVVPLDEPRGGRRRDRRGRGFRGPVALPGPLTPSGIPVGWDRRAQFDTAVLGAVARLRPRHAAALELLDVAVEDVPVLPRRWRDEVPLGTVVPDRERPRVVLFRQPVQHRVESRADLDDLVLSVLVDQLATLWRCDPDDLDPRM